ncbi:MAG: DUF2855 family protein [Burkholderiaceae bacterium]
MPEAPFDFQVHQDDLSRHRVLAPRRPVALAPGQALLRIERFALSSQNIVYGRLGSELPLRRLFPAPSPWARLPAWGYAQVAASTHPDASVGERLFGCLPMTNWLLVQPGLANARQFVDVSEHRRAFPAFYNTYRRTYADPSYRVAFEDHQMLMQSQFASAFVFAHHLAARRYCDARQIVLTGASSKTAAALAYLLRQEIHADCRVVGLTATEHRRFVQGLGDYDEVVDYARLTAMSAQVPTVLVDFAGDDPVHAALQRHFGDAIRLTCRILGGASGFGLAQWRALLDGIDVDGLRDSLTPAWNRFVDACAGWLRIDQHAGVDALARLYDSLLRGRVDPARGHVFIVGG